jgi:hypothetical protein
MNWWLVVLCRELDTNVIKMLPVALHSKNAVSIIRLLRQVFGLEIEPINGLCFPTIITF